jgi:hypothetical protein
MPTLVGSIFAFGSNVMAIRLKPRRASLINRWLKMCVSLKVPIWRCEWRVSPKFGMVFSASVGSYRRSFWKA